MNNITKGVFYQTEGQNAIGIQATVRSKKWEAVYLIQACNRVQALIYKLLGQDYTDSDELLMIYRSIMLDLIGVGDFLNHLNVSYNESLDNYNSMYIRDKTVEGLFKAVRNGLAHTTVNDGLLHKSGKICGNLAIPYYFLQGRDALFEYKFKVNKYSPDDDLCFGCGYHRISLLNHLIPYLKFSWDELKKYNQLHNGKKKSMPFTYEVLKKP